MTEGGTFVEHLFLPKLKQIYVMICKFNDYFGKDKEKGPWLDVFTPTPTRSGAEKVQKKNCLEKIAEKFCGIKKNL